MLSSWDGTGISKRDTKAIQQFSIDILQILKQRWLGSLFTGSNLLLLVIERLSNT